MRIKPTFVWNLETCLQIQTLILIGYIPLQPLFDKFLRLPLKIRCLEVRSHHANRARNDTYCAKSKRGYFWPLCMITSDEQISPPSLVCKENSLHLHSLCVDILFKFTALGHAFMQNFATLQFKTRLGGEICSIDINTHKGFLPHPLPPGQDLFKQFPTPGPEKLDLSGGGGMITGQLNHAVSHQFIKSL